MKRRNRLANGEVSRSEQRATGLPSKYWHDRAARHRLNPFVGPAGKWASLHQAPAGRHVYSHAPPYDALKPRRGGMGRAGHFHAAPMGLKIVSFGCLYYKHVAPTELAAAPNDEAHAQPPERGVACNDDVRVS